VRHVLAPQLDLRWSRRYVRTTLEVNHRFATGGTWNRRLVLDPPEKIYDFDPERLRYQVETCQGNVHSAVFERANLRSMQTRFVCKLVLREPALEPQLLNSRAQPLLDGLPLQQTQFRGILRKRILLIRRGWARHSSTCWSVIAALAMFRGQRTLNLNSLNHEGMQGHSPNRHSSTTYSAMDC